MQYWIIKNQDDVRRILADVYEKAIHHDYYKPVKVFFEEYKPTRSLNQNALSHVWYREIAKHLLSIGETFDDGTPMGEDYIKQECKKMFLYTESKKRKGKDVNLPVKTSKLPAGEMYDYMQRIFVWANNIGCTLPVPQDSEFYKMRLQND